MKTLKVYSLNNFQICDRVLLAIVIMLYITSQEFIYLIVGSLYLLTAFAHFSSCPYLTFRDHQSALYFYEFSFVFKIISHISEIIQYLSYFVWLISLTIMILASNMLSQMVGFPYFSWLNNIPLCVRACVFVCVYLHAFVCINNLSIHQQVNG